MKDEITIKTYDVRLYYSGYATKRVQAANEDDAFEKARNLPIDTKEIASTLQLWSEADEIEEVSK